jgi:hypothetical protein
MELWREKVSKDDRREAASKKKGKKGTTRNPLITLEIPIFGVFPTVPARLLEQKVR